MDKTETLEFGLLPANVAGVSKSRQARIVSVFMVNITLLRSGFANRMPEQNP